jgi:hypothetical protein
VPVEQGHFPITRQPILPPLKQSLYSPRIGNLTGRSGISAFARRRSAEICGYVNGNPARSTFWFSVSFSGSSVVTDNLGGKGGDKEGGDAVKSASVALPFPLSKRGSGLGDFSISASKTGRGGAGGVVSPIAEAALLPKPRKR